MSFNYKNINLFGYSIFTDELEKIDLSQKCIINTINPHSYVVAKSDADFKNALLSSDILLPDGIGIVLAGKVLSKANFKRIAGADIHKFILEKINENKGKVFYMGSSKETLSKIEQKLDKEYSNIVYKTYSPPFKDKFTTEENNKIINKINDFKPNILFVGMTAPKQEKWSFDNDKEINVNVIVSIGAVFDFYAGNVKRAPVFIQKMGLEWLHRSFTNPTRLGKRNLFSNTDFVLDILKTKFNK